MNTSTRAATLLLGSLTLTVVLVWWTASGPPAVDRTLHDTLLGTRGSPLVTLAGLVTWLGSIWVLVPVLLLSCVVLPRSTRPVLHGSWVLATFGLAVLLRSVLQPLVGRDRPGTDGLLADGPGASFPSGHTLQLVVALGLLLTLYGPVNAHVRAWCTTAAVLLVGAVGLTRLHLGVHWPTDVLGGAVLGVGVLALWSLTAPWRPDPDPRRSPVPFLRGRATSGSPSPTRR